MARTAAQAKIDPLEALIGDAFSGPNRRPIPLVSTSFDVRIEGGLATVATKRIFRNDETASIEATIAFPVPVHAVLFALEARVDGRVLKAKAQRRAAARETYEDAIERGKGAVLHEEVLRGVHLLSVAHLAPGAEIEVSTSWAAALTCIGDTGRLRIPLTVGDVYGRSPLPDSDDLVHGGAAGTAELTVRCSDGSVELLGGRLEEGRASIPLNAPIDLIAHGWAPRDLRARAADGRDVVLRIAPHPGGAQEFDVAILVDHSGSTGEAYSAARPNVTKHRAIVNALASYAGSLKAGDGIELWEFDDAPRFVGSTRAGAKKSSAEFRALLSRLSGPAGGTEIGRALGTVIARSQCRNILLVTDGKSHAIDVQALARHGRRISVVLVGEDSLEANVGHLAALTGGDIFVALGDDPADVLRAALESLRLSFEPAPAIAAPLARVRAVHGNAELIAEWRPAAEDAPRTPALPGVAAVAASLALPALDETEATRLAEAEGLVTHLTSLVLVDEAAEIQEGVPASRKVALPTPRTAVGGAPPHVWASQATVRFDLRPLRSPSGFDACLTPGAPAPEIPFPSPDDELTLAQIGELIDWDVEPERLRAGDLSAIGSAAATAIDRAARLPAVVAAAKRLGIGPRVLIVALVARARATANRSAARLATAILGKHIADEIEALARELGLEPGAAKRG